MASVTVTTQGAANVGNSPLVELTKFTITTVGSRVLVEGVKLADAPDGVDNVYDKTLGDLLLLDKTTAIALAAAIDTAADTL